MNNLPSLYKGVLHENIRDLIDYCAENTTQKMLFILKTKKEKM